MTITLTDPTGDPSSRRTTSASAAGWPTLIPPSTIADELLAGFRSDTTPAEATFALESHGGYAHTVTGTIAYLDEDAKTFMVREADGQLTRVPLRDVTSWLAATSKDAVEEAADDAEGVGTGNHRSTSAPPSTG